MSDYFKIKASTGEYAVQIGRNLSHALQKSDEQVIILCDKFFESDFRVAGNRVIAIETSETAKSLDQMSAIIVALREFGANRSTRLLAVGGGVIQDITTFVASIYMRGLSWDYFPTTLLGMVDSCVGGKSSINVGDYKNLIGNFYPPRDIIIDLAFVDTLNVEQRAAGLFEAVKICFAQTDNAFNHYLLLQPDPTSTPDVFREVVKLSLLTKRWFIETDEHDKNERLLLNFGHTFGHAIEGSCGFVIPHGIAVGMGILAALEFSRLETQAETSPPRVVQLQQYVNWLLQRMENLSSWRRQIVVGDLMKRFASDKKHTTRHYAVIVPDEHGYLVRRMIEKTDANCVRILRAFNVVCGSAPD